MAKKQEQMIEVPNVEIKEMDITIVGDSPLIMHKWSEKAKKQMRDKQQKKATAGRPSKDPEADFESAIYRTPEGKYAFPAVAFKAAAVRAAQSTQVPMTKSRQMFHIPGELIEIQTEAAPIMREDIVSVGNGAADLRYRPEFAMWSAQLHIRYNAAIVSAPQIINFFNIAGFGVGIGEWRPEKNGQNGMFHVDVKSVKI